MYICTYTSTLFLSSTSKLSCLSNSPVSLSQNMTQPQTNCNRIYFYGIMYIDYLQITRKKLPRLHLGEISFFHGFVSPPPPPILIFPLIRNCHFGHFHNVFYSWINARFPWWRLSGWLSPNNKRLSHGWQCDMIFIKRVVVRYHERARNERVSDITPTRVW